MRPNQVTVVMHLIVCKIKFTKDVDKRQYAACHTLNGIVLKPYPTMESWFLEEKENLKESMEYYDQALQKKSETL